MGRRATVAACRDQILTVPTSGETAHRGQTIPYASRIGCPIGCFIRSVFGIVFGCVFWCANDTRQLTANDGAPPGLSSTCPKDIPRAQRHISADRSRGDRRRGHWLPLLYQLNAGRLYVRLASDAWAV